MANEKRTSKRGIPEVKLLAENKPLEVTHLLSDQVYCHMTAEKLDTLNIHNVLAAAAVDELNAELDFVKDQITTTEVNMAHVYNYGVQMRKANANAVLSSS
uniref:Uncharacterized protein n=1 Tax=Parascaris equorum TaxID=6256 RepID=A0A914RZ46_PAREQ